MPLWWSINKDIELLVQLDIYAGSRIQEQNKEMSKHKLSCVKLTETVQLFD